MISVFPFPGLIKKCQEMKVNGLGTCFLVLEKKTFFSKIESTVQNSRSSL